MSHIHLPDGIIPVFWWVVGYIITGGILALAFSQTKALDVRRRVPLLGIMAAVMLIGQSVPLGFIPFHLNLAALSGIVLGPWLGFIAVFIANLFLALLGHGGITVVGLNTLVVGSEAVLSYLLFSALKRAIPSELAAAALATALVLVVSVSLLVGVVALSQVNPVVVLTESVGLADNGADPPVDGISVIRFVQIIVPFAVVGILIEAIATGFIVRFVSQVRPEIIRSKKS